MILRPSLSNDFARSPGESLFPGLWKKLVLAIVPEWLAAGDSIYNWGTFENYGPVVKPASAIWSNRLLNWNGQPGFAVLNSYPSYASCWGTLMRPDSNDGDGGIVGWTGVGIFTQFWVDNNGATLRWGSQYNNNVVYGSDLIFGKRHNFAARLGPDGMRVFVDGKLEIDNAQAENTDSVQSHHIFQTQNAVKQSVNHIGSMFYSLDTLNDSMLRRLSTNPLLLFEKPKTHSYTFFPTITDETQQRIARKPLASFAKTKEDSASPHLWEGCSFAWAAPLGEKSVMVDYAGKNGIAVNEGAEWRVNEIGQYAWFASGADRGFEFRVPRKNIGTDDFCLVALIFPTQDGFFDPFISYSTGVTGATVACDFIWAASNGLRLDIGDGVAFDTVNSTTGVVTQNEWNVVAVQRTGGSNIEFFSNGESAGTGTSSRNVQFPNFFKIGAKSSTYRFDNGGMAMVLRYDRALTEAEHRQLATDPFAMFRHKPQVTKFYEPVLPEATARVTVKNVQPDYATNAFESAHPELWQGLEFSYMPLLGHTGPRLIDYRRRYETAISGTVDWIKRSGDQFWRVNNAAYTLPPNVTTGAKAISVVTLARPDGPPSFKHIGGRHNDFYFGHTAGAIKFSINGNDVLGSVPTSGQVYSWCGTYNGTNIRLYQDGLIVNSTPYTSNIANTGTFCIGSFGTDPNNATYMYDGDIGQFLVYSRVLSENEIKILAADPFAPFRPKNTHRTFEHGVNPNLSANRAARLRSIIR